MEPADTVHVVCIGINTRPGLCHTLCPCSEEQKKQRCKTHSARDVHGPQLISLILLESGHRHCHIPILDHALFGPVLATLVSSQFHTLGRHDDHVDLLLPHHPPEIDQRLLCWTWRQEEASLLIAEWSKKVSKTISKLRNARWSESHLVYQPAP